MAIYRVQIGFPLDTGLPRDVVTINPHYFGDNPQALGDAIKTNLIANANIANVYPFKIKVYDAQKAPPSFPLYETSNGTGNPATSVPREIALCLSYYSTWNRPRYRGRLYIPGAFVATGTENLRPTATAIGKALSFGSTLGRNLPGQHNWVVYSQARNAGDAVTNYWVDDEWDVQRSRGMRGTTRQTGTIP